MDALIFIDTNIFLDFYRLPKGAQALSILGHIDKHHDKIITSSQVEMEYKKNRQKVILNAQQALNNSGLSAAPVPAFLADTQPAKMSSKHRKQFNTQQKWLRKKIERILKNPSQNDPVYKVLQRLFKNKGECNLSRDNKERYRFRRLAWKRFILGYPPRKKNDTSIGDAVNWEWVIQCALASGKDIVLVSRDSDFGINYGNEPVLNDWLLQEFKQRVSRKRKIVLTNKLTEAFKWAEINVSVTEEEIEKKLVAKTKEKINQDEFELFFRKILADVSSSRKNETFEDFFIK